MQWSVGCSGVWDAVRVWDAVECGMQYGYCQGSLPCHREYCQGSLPCHREYRCGAMSQGVLVRCTSRVACTAVTAAVLDQHAALVTSGPAVGSHGPLAAVCTAPATCTVVAAVGMGCSSAVRREPCRLTHSGSVVVTGSSPADSGEPCWATAPPGPQRPLRLAAVLPPWPHCCVLPQAVQLGIYRCGAVAAVAAAGRQCCWQVCSPAGQACGGT
jgi:hypothetical protein